MVKCIDSALDHMELHLVLLAEFFLREAGFFFIKIYFATEISGSTLFLLPAFSTGGKWYFQVANLLLATDNFEP